MAESLKPEANWWLNAGDCRRRNKKNLTSPSRVYSSIRREFYDGLTSLRSAFFSVNPRAQSFNAPKVWSTSGCFIRRLILDSPLASPWSHGQDGDIVQLVLGPSITMETFYALCPVTSRPSRGDSQMQIGRKRPPVAGSLAPIIPTLTRMH